MIKLYFLFLVFELPLGLQKVILDNNMENMENHPNLLALGQVAKSSSTSCFLTRLSLNASSMIIRALSKNYLIEQNTHISF